MKWESHSDLRAIIWILAVQCWDSPICLVTGHALLLCWDLGFGYCVDAHCQLPLPKFCIYLVLMPALFGCTSPLHIFCITTLGYMETFGFIYIRSAFSRPTHLTMSYCHLPFTVAIQNGQGTPCIIGRKWDTNPLSFHPDLQPTWEFFLFDSPGTVPRDIEASDSFSDSNGILS